MRWTGPICWCLATLLLSSCSTKRVAAPPPSKPIVIPNPTPPPKEATLPPGPSIPTNTKPATAKLPEAPVTLPPPPPKPEPTKKRRTARKKETPKPEAPKVAESKPAESEGPKSAEAGTPEPAAPVIPTPQLEVILTPEQNRDYTRRIDGALDRARNALLLIQSKTLSSDQKEILSRIQNFVAQAEQARAQDLVSSLSLAERADLLSKDLLDRIVK